MPFEPLNNGIYEPVKRGLPSPIPTSQTPPTVPTQPINTPPTIPGQDDGFGTWREPVPPKLPFGLPTPTPPVAPVAPTFGGNIGVSAGEVDKGEYIPPVDMDGLFGDRGLPEPFPEPVVAPTPEEPVVAPEQVVIPPTPEEPVVPEDRSLKDPGFITEGGQLGADFWTDQFKQGEFSDVESRRGQLDREGDQAEYKALKMARDTATRMGMEPGTAGYNQLMEDAMSGVNQLRLGNEQSINEMQRDYRDTATNELQEIEGNQRISSVGERNFEFNRDDILYARGKSEELKDETDVRNMINAINDPKFKNALEAEFFVNDVEGVKALVDSGMTDGTINEENASQGVFETTMQGINEEVDGMAYSPDGDAWKDGEREIYKSKLLDSQMRMKYGLNDDQIEQTDTKLNATAKVKELLAGNINSNDITAEEWGAMTPEQLQSVSVDFNNSMTYLRPGDFVNSDLKADQVSESVDQKSPFVKDEHSAGNGNGSIVLIGGVPHRITRYDSHKDTTNINERSGTIYGVPLSGPSAGTETTLSSTGMKKI